MEYRTLITEVNGLRHSTHLYNVCQSYHTLEGYTITFYDSQEDMHLCDKEFISMSGVLLEGSTYGY